MVLALYCLKGGGRGGRRVLLSYITQWWMLDSFCCVDLAFCQLEQEPKAQKGPYRASSIQTDRPLEDIEKKAVEDP